MRQANDEPNQDPCTLTASDKMNTEKRKLYDHRKLQLWLMKLAPRVSWEMVSSLLCTINVKLFSPNTDIHCRFYVYASKSKLNGVGFGLPIIAPTETYLWRPLLPPLSKYDV